MTAQSAVWYVPSAGVRRTIELSILRRMLIPGLSTGIAEANGDGKANHEEEGCDSHGVLRKKRRDNGHCCQ